jgi:tetratricopeptide repeat protein 30
LLSSLLKEYIHRRSIGGRYAREARQKFMDAQQALGYQADLAYNIALCYYRMKQFGPALKHLAEIIERGVREHPELSVGSQTDGMEVKSVGNTPVLKETALIEAFNLKAAIEYVMKNPDATREALTDMPPRSEEELDPVTLHNIALMNMAGARLYSCVACHIQSLTHSLMKGALVSIHDPPYR